MTAHCGSQSDHDDKVHRDVPARLCRGSRELLPSAPQLLALSAEGGGEGGADEDYASSGSEADDEATLEEEDALAAQDGLDQKVCASLIAQLTLDL